MNDPAMLATEKIIEAFPALRGQMLHGMPTIIRDAYSETLAAKDAELSQLKEVSANVIACKWQVAEGKTVIDFMRLWLEQSYSERNRLAARIAKLEKQVEELRRDAERYRWLRQDTASELGQPWCVTRLTGSIASDDLVSVSHARLDAAIDAALKETT